DGGRETEADYSVSEANIESLSFDGKQWTATIDVTCAKLVERRADGKPYAPGAPSRFRAQGTAWARAPSL
ncbi:MAG: hypothetical protein AAFY60_08945, partial [Myxococcota bacterium]